MKTYKYNGKYYRLLKKGISTNTFIQVDGSGNTIGNPFTSKDIAKDGELVTQDNNQQSIF